jgi:hypothetical protein
MPEIVYTKKEVEELIEKALDIVSEYTEMAYQDEEIRTLVRALLDWPQPSQNVAET